MAPRSTLTAEDTTRIRAAIPSLLWRKHFATIARIYYAFPDPDQWSYTNLEGALVFAEDKANGSLWFKMVDLDSTRGVIWEYQLPELLDYHRDRTFFHSFMANHYMTAFVFSDEAEANIMLRTIQELAKLVVPRGRVLQKQHVKVDKSTISAPFPETFEHRKHMGYSPEHGFSCSGVEPRWIDFVQSSLGALTRERSRRPRTPGAESYVSTGTRWVQSSDGESV